MFQGVTDEMSWIDVVELQLADMGAHPVPRTVAVTPTLGSGLSSADAAWFERNVCRCASNSSGPTTERFRNCWSGWRTSWLDSTCGLRDPDMASTSLGPMGAMDTGKARKATWCSIK